MTSPKDYADSARELSKIIGAALERHIGDLVAMTVTGTVKCAKCGLPVTWEGFPKGWNVDWVTYKNQCQLKSDRSGSMDCPEFRAAGLRALHLAEEGGQK